MENRLELNKKSILKLPEMTMFRVQPSTHNIEEEYKKWKPNIRICSYGDGSIGKILTDDSIKEIISGNYNDTIEKEYDDIPETKENPNSFWWVRQ